MKLYNPKYSWFADFRKTSLEDLLKNLTAYLVTNKRKNNQGNNMSDNQSDLKQERQQCPQSSFEPTNPSDIGDKFNNRSSTRKGFNNSVAGNIPNDNYSQWVKVTPRLQNDNPAKLTFKDNKDTTSDNDDESNSQESETAFE